MNPTNEQPGPESGIEAAINSFMHDHRLPETFYGTRVSLRNFAAYLMPRLATTAPVVPHEASGEWVMVPREPTDAMIRAAMDCQEADPADGDESAFYHAWKAAITAAPSPPPARAIAQQAPTFIEVKDGVPGAVLRAWQRIAAHCSPQRQDDERAVNDWLNTLPHIAPATPPNNSLRGDEGSLARGANYIDAFNGTVPMPSPTTPSALIDEAMVERALGAQAAYWADDSHVTKCKPCNGTGAVPIGGEGQDLCHLCGGNGTFHDGTEEGAMRAALEAAGLDGAGGADTVPDATPTVQPSESEGRCKSCDDTGDLHRADGEYLGPCPLHSEASQSALSLAKENASSGGQEGGEDIRERELAMLASTLIQRLRKAAPTDPWLDKAWWILGKHGHDSLLRENAELCIGCGGKGEVMGTYKPSSDPQDWSDMPVTCPACNGDGRADSATAPAPVDAPAKPFPPEPLRIFPRGRWTFDGDGRTATSEELEAIAYAVYRDAVGAPDAEDACP